MEYWRGWMDWPLDKDWKCETCGDVSLIWGFIHAQCRCDRCHTEYWMRDDEQERVTAPICQLKPEFKAPAQKAWGKYGKSINDLTLAQWIELGVPESAFE